MCPAPLPLGALRTKRLIGRTKEREAIKIAIEAEGELRILHIIGDGGMGKTRLLEAIPEEILPICYNKDRCQWGGIFDLYHTDSHTNSGIEAAIIKALAPEGFTEYRARREEYENLRRAGGSPRRLEELRKELGTLFVEDFNKVTERTRIVLCFDTVELVQYESDVVQEICGIEYRELEVREWLMHNIPKMQNVTVIFAGRRPRPELWRDLQTNFALNLGDPLLLQGLSGKPSEKTFLKEIKAARQIEAELKGLLEDETLEYFDALEEMAREKEMAGKIREIKEAVEGSIYPITGGIPLRLAMVIDMLLKDMILPAHLPATTYNQIEAQFVDWIGNFAPDVFVALPYVAWTRKGISPQLLQRLTGWDQQKCESILSTLKQFAFVKIRPDTDLIFLHDVMYDLMDKYVLQDRPLQCKEVCQKVIEYYDEKVQALPDEQAFPLVIEQLYYYLLADERSGYRQYTRLSEEALIGHRLDFEMGLRDELLRFFRERRRKIPDYIIRDCAVRWVKRYIAMGEHLKALEVAEAIRK